MDVFTVGNVLSVGIWRDGEAGMLAGGYESVPARNGCLVVVLISVGCLVAARLCQELLDDVGDEAPVGFSGELLAGGAHHLAHVLHGGGSEVGDDRLHLGFNLFL